MDSDSDGLIDSQESRLGLNPLSASSDGDSLPDAWEIRFGLDPLSSTGVNGNSGDPDGDGLTNLTEYQNGTNPQDYYNGLLPRLDIDSGNDSWGITNTFIEEPLVIQLTDTNEAAIANAPVTFSVSAGGGQIATSTNGSLVSTLTTTTDAGGFASVMLWMPPTTGTVSGTITAASGAASTQAVFTAAAVVDAPLCVAAVMRAADERYYAATGNHYTWPARTYGPNGLINTNTEVAATNSPPDDFYCYDLANFDYKELELVAALANVLNNDTVLTRFLTNQNVNGLSYLPVYSSSGITTNGNLIYTGGMPPITNITCSTYLRKLENFAQRVKRLQAVWFEAYATNYQARSLTSTGTGTNRCGDAKLCAMSNYPPAWGTNKSYVFTGGSCSGPPAGAVSGQSPIRVLINILADSAVATHIVENTRGKFGSDLRRFTAGSSTLYVKSTRLGNEFGQQAPTGEDKFGFSGLIPAIAQNWVSVAYLAASEKIPTNYPTVSKCNVPVGDTNQPPSEFKQIGWQISDQVVIVKPVFGVFNPASCAGGCFFKVIDTEWEGVTIEGATNLSADNPSPSHGGGWRLFSEKNSSTGALHNVIKARADLNQGVTGNGRVRVLFRIFDMDDPTQNGAGNVVDTNDTATASNGDDNKGAIPGISPSGITGVIVSNASVATLTYTNTHRQPGNNYRVAAHISRCFIDDVAIDTRPAVGKGIDFTLQSNTNAVPGEKKTPLLSIWRTLNMEVDSMGSVTGNVVTGTGDSATPNVPIAGRSTLDVGKKLPDEANRFDEGSITISGVGTFSVVSNTDNLINDDEVVVAGVVSNSQFQGLSYTLVDDDDKNLPASLIPPLPKYDLVTSEVLDKFVPAYIRIRDAATLGLNPRSNVVFKLNGDASVTSAKDLQDEADFWAHLIISGYQPALDEDNDPIADGVTVGETVPSSQYSVIYVEGVRDSIAGIIGTPGGASVFASEVSGTVAHETAHPPGGQSAALDHAEGGLMGEGVTSGQFTTNTIKRLRQTIHWQE